MHFYAQYKILDIKTQGNINISKFMLGAVVKKSDTTTVFYSKFEQLTIKNTW